MKKKEINCLEALFETLNISFSYVVTRNGDELPFVNNSNDIDILINESDFIEIDILMKSVFKSFGFNRLERTTFHGIECYTFYNLEEKTPLSIKIDLFFNYEGGGVFYYKFSDLIEYKIKNKYGVYMFSPDVESFLTAYKTIAAGGKLKKKYFENLLKNRIDSNHKLVVNSPSKRIINYIESILNQEENPDLKNRKIIINETLKNNFIQNPFRAIGRFCKHYIIELKRAFKKQYFVVFVGPDGSGKTTLIEKLKSESESIFKSDASRFTIKHHRPHWLPNIAQIFKKNLSDDEVYDLNFNPHSEKQSGFLVSFLKLCYYSVDYTIGYLLKVIKDQRANKFIVFDRYFFDFIVDQKRSALKVNKRTAIWFYKLFVPKPNNVFFIKVDAQKAHDRKKELPVNSIKKINNSYEELSIELKGFATIVNDDLDESYRKLRLSFIKVITNKI